MPTVTPVPLPVPRQVRRAAARQAQRAARRQAVHAAVPPPPDPVPPPPWGLPRDQPLYDTLLTWLEALLAHAGCPRPARKRLALLGAALLAREEGPGTPAGIARTAFDLGIGTATQEASVARRVARLLDDPHLDPARLLPDLTRALLPVILAEVERAHAHTIGTTAAHAAHATADHPPGHHGRWVGVRVVVDETTKEDQTHVLVVGLAYRGVVLPLGVRTWPQHVALPEGAYWQALGALLWEVHAALPPVLRAHVLVLADRGYGVPAFMDLLAALGWQWVVRVKGSTHVLFPDGSTRALRRLVPQPGTSWCGQAAPSAGTTAPVPADLAGSALPAVPIAGVFKKAGGRGLQVVAVWVEGETEPWLLVTTLAATPARCLDYARRWAIERLFLAWKSHGWDLEACAVAAPARLARLLSGYVVATWWLLAAAVPVVQAHLEALAASAVQRLGRQAPHLAHPCQLRLPGLTPPVRPWAAKFSLLTHGRRAFRRAGGKAALPALCWRFPEWDAPTWSAHCLEVYHGGAPLP